MNYSKIALRVINHEANSLKLLINYFEQNLTSTFEQIINFLLHFSGRIITTGIGKSGHIAQKIAASLSSTGNTAYYINLAEAAHGDLGMITKKDLVIVFSSSGNNPELASVIEYCLNFSIKIVGITSKSNSLLAQKCTYLLSLPEVDEVSEIIAPTTSSLMMLAMGDALMTTLHETKNFTSDNYRIFHPGGKIGQALLKLTDIMIPQKELTFINIYNDFEKIIEEFNKGFIGCILVNDVNFVLKGIITNYDLRKFYTIKSANLKAKDLMNCNFKSITLNSSLQDAQNILNEYSISYLPILQNKIVIGLITRIGIIKAGLF